MASMDEALGWMAQKISASQDSVKEIFFVIFFIAQPGKTMP